MRLLLIEDEKRLSDALAHILKKHNYTVDVAYDGQSGELLAESNIYDLIILDRMLPVKDGLDLLKSIRNQGINTPVILVTARDTIEDRVQGLDAGADDYLVKPFATEELLARLRALGRRGNEQMLGDRLNLGSLVLDPLQCEVVIGSETVKLTLKECQVLELFMRNPGQVITKEQILDRIWGFDSEIDFNNVEIYIHHLRKKLKPQQSVSINTVRGIGYCLKEDNHVS